MLKEKRREERRGIIDIGKIHGTYIRHSLGVYKTGSFETRADDVGER